MEKFLQHLNEVGLTYPQHFKRSMKFSRMFFGLMVCSFVHAIFPFWFKKSTTNGLKELQKQMETIE